VTGVHLKSSSGVQDIDALALNFIQSRKYNARPGCPVIDSEESVQIHLQ